MIAAALPAALPAVPGTSCPTAAAALGAAGLGPVCQAVSGAAGSAATQVAGVGVDSVLDALGSWVSAGAVWLMAQIGRVISDTTSIDLGASWFAAHYRTMAALAGVVIVPLLLLGVIQSIYRQSASMLMRSVVVNVPLAIVLTAVAVKLVQLGLAVTDAMSAAVAHSAGLDTGHFMAGVTAALSGSGGTAQPGVPAFILFLGGLAVVFGAVAVWVELLVRAAAVYVAVLFLPLALASLAWPAIAHWCRRLVDTLVALVLGKFVIVSVLSLAAGALAGGTGGQPSGSGSSGSGGGFDAVLGGAALLLLASLAPWALFRLLPFLEAGAVGHLEGLGRRTRQTATGPAKGLAMTAMRASGIGSLAGAGAGALAGVGSGMGRAAGSAGASGRGPSPGSGPGAGAVPPLGGGGPGGDGPESTRPESPPSSAESTGVGTTHPPGQGIPSWAVNTEATAAANRGLAGPADGEPRLPTTTAMRSAAPAGTAMPAAAPVGAAMPAAAPVGAGMPAAAPAGTDRSTIELPRQTGALHPDSLGRDHLGVRLIAGPTTPAPTTPSPTETPRPGTGAR